MIAYLDNASTTKPSEAAVAASLDALTESYGNPSSVHTLGQAAERIMKDARASVAAALGAHDRQIVFTGGGTEANNLAIHSVFRNPARTAGRRIIISAVEHPSVFEPAALLARRGAALDVLPVDGRGACDTAALAGMLDAASGAQRTALVSVMHVNNELGTIEPVAEIARIIAGVNKRYGADIVLHTDAVQSFGKLPVDAGGAFGGTGLLSVSAHKIHGPKGVGALYAARPEKLDPILLGGGQERGRRSGTENVPGIAGFGAAVAECAASAGGIGAEDEGGLRKHAERAARLRGRLMDGITGAVPDVRVNSPAEASCTGEAGYCSPYILNVSFLGTRGEVLLHDLEQHGVYVSTGSACSNLGKAGKGGAAVSPVLAAAGLSRREQEGAVRFSLSRFTTEDEIDYALEHLTAAVARYRKIGAYR
jgi:cysteine desulfurase